MNQDSNKPVPKVAAVGQAGVVVTGILLVLAQFHIIIPAEVGTAVVALIGAVVTIVTFLAGYFKKSNVKEV